MSDQAKILENLEKIIHQHTGVKITELLQKKLVKYCSEHYSETGFSSELDFSEYLLTQPVDSADIKKLITETTVAESYFFRHKAMLNFIKDIWLPEIIKKRRDENNLNLRIWSAGCAAGQELYTVAMMVLEKIKDIDDWNIHLIGTDIDAQAIAQARSARYGDWSFRDGSTPPDQYFRKNNLHYEIKDPLKKSAKFSYLNLIDDGYPSIANGTNNIDLIICCNVLIYLTDENALKILDQFSHCLNKEGYLILAPSDFVKQVPVNLEKKQDYGMTYYQLGIEKLETGKSNAIPISPGKEKYEALLAVLFKQLNHEEWQAALTTIERCILLEGETALLLQFKANSLANLGDLDQALKLCNKSIAENQNDPHSYLIKAMIMLGLNRPDEAEVALRQALLLNSDFVEVQFHLGSLLIRLDRWDEGIKLLRSSAELIKKFDPNRKVHHAPRLSFSQFSKIIENEISAYENARNRTA